ncbi:HlyD family efflux transporter periplasmic adaptor subunit [Streptomyces chartreusis]|uniref:HlyD family efflux transporter periplasmic adaptor subunit n=1 Tax=Streptomyces chartreusis TaxID=1969 RepID=UPI0036B34B3A
MKFREEALKARQASDILDQPVRLTSTRGWLAVFAVAIAVGIGVTWAFLGRLPQDITATGLLTTRGGSFTVQTAQAGQIVDLFVKPGSAVQPDTAVAVVRVASGKDITIRSMAAGRVFAVRTHTGDVVQAGTPLLVAENTDASSDGLIAAVYVPASQLPEVTPGRTVRLKLSSAPENGELLGHVLSAAETSETVADIGAFLGDDQLAATLANSGARYRVLIDLDQGSDGDYAWTRSTAASAAVNSRTTVLAAIEQPAVRPADWVFPS